MAPIPKISDAEWEVMKILWERSPRSANEIVESLSGTDWSPPTIRTLITRLVKKCAVGHTKAGREYHYTPLLTRKECARHERQSLVRRVYNGATQPMLAHFLEDEDLSAEELEMLKGILERKKVDPS